MIRHRFASHNDTSAVGEFGNFACFNKALSGLKPKIQGGLAAWSAHYFLFRIRFGPKCDIETRVISAGLSISFVYRSDSDRLKYSKQTSAFRDHLEKAAARGMVFGVGLRVLGKLCDSARQQRDLNIPAARVLLSCSWNYLVSNVSALSAISKALF